MRPFLRITYCDKAKKHRSKKANGKKARKQRSKRVAIKQNPRGAADFVCLYAFVLLCFIARYAVIFATCFVSRDFRRDAVFLVMTFVFAALSSAW